MKLIRYYRNTGALHIGTENNKISIYIPDKMGVCTIKGKKVFHFGRW